jgi:hypothetical protein
MFLVSLESFWHWCLWKVFDKVGCMGLVLWCLDICALVVLKVLEYWMISSLKIKLNRSWKFQKNWNVPLVLMGFGFRMWEILIFKWFLLLKIPKKTRFWKEKSVEDMVQATLVSSNLQNWIQELVCPRSLWVKNSIKKHWCVINSTSSTFTKECHGWIVEYQLHLS